MTQQSTDNNLYFTRMMVASISISPNGTGGETWLASIVFLQYEWHGVHQTITTNRKMQAMQQIMKQKAEKDICGRGWPVQEGSGGFQAERAWCPYRQVQSLSSDRFVSWIRRTTWGQPRDLEVAAPFQYFARQPQMLGRNNL